MIGNIHYLNSGDWVESMTALVETEEGEWRIIYYADWVKERTELKGEEVSERLSTESIPKESFISKTAML